MFKLYLIALIAVATSCAAVDNFNEDFVDGLLLESTNYLIAAAAEAEFVCPAGVQGNVCASDCQTLLSCTSSSTKPIIINKCSDISTNSPYCNPGKTGCSTTEDANNANCVTSSTTKFICTNEGYFPDPTNCTKYHVCTEDLEQTYVCPPNYVYDALNSRCKLKRYATDCVTLNCATSPNRYVVYPPNKAYYAFCGISAGVSNIILFRCADTVNFQFNPTSIDCEFVCKAEGWYADYTNCKKYYECYKSGLKFLSRTQTCPTSYIFNATQKLCVKGECAVDVTTEATTIPTTTTTLIPPLDL